MKKIIMSISLVIAGLGCSTMSQQAYGMNNDDKKLNEAFISGLSNCKNFINGTIELIAKYPEAALAGGCIAIIGGGLLIASKKVHNFFVGATLIGAGVVVALEGNEAKKPLLEQAGSGALRFVDSLLIKGKDLDQTFQDTLKTPLRRASHILEIIEHKLKTTKK